jgi:hypothetical protein
VHSSERSDLAVAVPAHFRPREDDFSAEWACSFVSRLTGRVILRCSSCNLGELGDLLGVAPSRLIGLCVRAQNPGHDPTNGAEKAPKSASGPGLIIAA